MSRRATVGSVQPEAPLRSTPQPARRPSTFALRSDSSPMRNDPVSASAVAADDPSGRSNPCDPDDLLGWLDEMNRWSKSRFPAARIQTTISYGPSPEQTIDVWSDGGAERRAVIVAVHGGGF